MFHEEIPKRYRNDFVNESIYDIIDDFAPNIDYVMHECRWQQQKNCFDYISPMMTHKGKCFAFNALSSYDMYTDQ